jgi:alkylation response protein AidB-like acyl-CoA dehydrogenase
MQFGFTPEQEAFKREVKQFIADHLTPQLEHEIEHGHQGETRGPLVNAMYRKLGEKGWLAISWPKEYGGQDADRIKQYIVEEEFTRMGIPIAFQGSGAPAIMGAGTEEQKRFFVPSIVSGNVSFCQGFTEPGCGADLAGIQCRAVRDGDHYVVNGQKMFTSLAHTANYIYLLVRTDPDAPRHKGISILLAPMNLPGITVRPLWTLQTDPEAPWQTTYGMPRTNEVFFDDVHVPCSCLLGKENDGFAVSATGLNLDRVGAMRYLMSVRRDEDIINWVKEHRLDSYSPAQDPAIRDRLAEMWIEAQLCRLMTMRSMAIEERAGVFRYEGSAEKVWAPEHGTRITEMITQVLGPYTQLLNGSEGAIQQGLYGHQVLGAWISAVAHGSVQVMRDQIARRGLGLSRPT